ncbi:MAG TPA: hypothetical protein VFG28_04425 [Syntrophales bacterium]|nr:hypothetical protein [Syntrophales bacterium]
MGIAACRPSRAAFRTWLRVVIFSAAFAYVESAVVVYLREIYFDGAFEFPIVTVWENGRHVLDRLILVEMGREAATVIMLALIGVIAGCSALQRFCFFMIAFGVWDIFYYVWLRVILGWPDSLMTWDLLFYIPLPWVGPVIAPVLIAATMVAAGTALICIVEKGFTIRWHWADWAIEMGCGFLLIVAFCWDWRNILRVPDGNPYSGIPNPFAWWLFLPAYLFALVYFAVRVGRTIRAGAGSR